MGKTARCSHGWARAPRAAGWRGGVLLCALLVATAARAANPFLHAADDQPVAANFTGTEWGDDIANGERPFSARVVTTRLAELPFGAVFKIELIEVADKAAPPRRLSPWYFLATDSEIAVIKDADPAAVIARLQQLAKAPPLVPPDVYGISRGSRTYRIDKLSVAKLTVTGDRSIYKWTHSAGHFTTLIWQRGVGLVELAQGRGARADGFRLLRSAAAGTPPGAAATSKATPARAPASRK